MQAKSTDKPDSLAAFAHRLGILAGRRRLKQAEIARRLSQPGSEISPQRVGGWFQGRHFPGGEIERDLAAILGVSRDWLIEGKENTDSTEAGALREDAASYGDTETIARHIAEHYAALIAGAGNDVARLGWIAEQMKEHLAIPKTWRQSAPDPMAVVHVKLPSQATPANPSSSRHARPA